MSLRAAFVLFTLLALLSGCDDMSVQPKAGAWSRLAAWLRREGDAG